MYALLFKNKPLESSFGVSFDGFKL